MAPIAGSIEIQSHLRRVRFVLGCFVVMIILTVLLRIYSPKHMPRGILFFAILSELYGVCMILWLIRRLKKKSKLLGLSKNVIEKI